MQAPELESGHVRVAVDAHVLKITLDRADKRNALTGAMYADMKTAVAHASDNDDVRAVLIDAEGEMFCAGNDIQDFANREPRTTDDVVASPALTFIKTLAACDKPVVAAIQGQATGIGTTMLLHVDLVIAADSARFFTAFIDLGLVPEAGSSLILPALIGRQNTARLLLAGDTFDAVEAERMGLIAYRVADAELATAAAELAARLAQKPLDSLRYTKQLMRAAADPDALEQQIEHEARLFGERLASDEVQQIMAGFLNRRRS